MQANAMPTDTTNNYHEKVFGRIKTLMNWLRRFNRNLIDITPSLHCPIVIVNAGHFHFSTESLQNKGKIFKTNNYCVQSLLRELESTFQLS